VKQNSKKTALLLTLLCSLGTAQAESRYVTDQFKITLRSGESASHKIVRMLPSGTKLELIRANAETGYSEVRTEGGTEGYVLTRQLMDKPSARERLAAAEARVKELEEEPGKLSSKLATLQDEYQALKEAHSQNTRQNRELSQELESIRRTAADSLRMAEERTTLRKSVADLTRQVADLEQQNRDLSNKEIQNWFLKGAGVIVLGIIIGLILPRLHVQRRRDSWDSL
jgi:SH3 domain protein